MIIHSERSMTREVYNRMDEALEYANSQLRMETEKFARELFNLYAQGANSDTLAQALHTTPTLSQHSMAIALQLVDTMTAIYKAQEAMKEAQHQAELLVETIRHVKDETP